MSMNNAIDSLEDLLERRHSCRGFRPEPVPRELIQRILDTARRTASWCNAQPWQVHIVSGPRLDALRADMMARAKAGAPPTPELDWPKEYRGIYQARRRECGWDLYRAVGVAKGDREGSARQSQENFRGFGAPHLAIVTSEALLGTHGVMDVGAWVSNFMLAATALGVASIAQAAIASWPDVLRKHVDIADDRRIVCGISFGFEDTLHPANSFRTTRAPLEEVAFWVE
jgi:nitroreductase